MGTKIKRGGQPGTGIPLPKYRKRGIAYFDLLGFRLLVRQRNLPHVMYVYEKALESLDRKTAEKEPYGISTFYFSDTFVITANNDSAKSFAWLEQAARLFYVQLLQNKIPVRGALSVGDLYTRTKDNVIVGPALIDAYDYGECFNWLGFVTTPKAYERLEVLDLSLNERLNYRRIDSKEYRRLKSDEPGKVTPEEEVYGCVQTIKISRVLKKPA